MKIDVACTLENSGKNSFRGPCLCFDICGFISSPWHVTSVWYQSSFYLPLICIGGEGSFCDFAMCVFAGYIRIFPCLTYFPCLLIGVFQKVIFFLEVVCLSIFSMSGGWCVWVYSLCLEVGLSEYILYVWRLVGLSVFCGCVVFRQTAASLWTRFI